MPDIDSTQTMQKQQMFNAICAQYTVCIRVEMECNQCEKSSSVNFYVILILDRQYSRIA